MSRYDFGIRSSSASWALVRLWSRRNCPRSQAKMPILAFRKCPEVFLLCNVTPSFGPGASRGFFFLG